MPEKKPNLDPPPAPPSVRPNRSVVTLALVAGHDATRRRPVTAPGRRRPEGLALRAGDVLHLTRVASPQFARPIRVRLIRMLDWTTYDGWLWVDVYQLGPDGNATARRSLFMRRAGVRMVAPPPVSQRRPRTGALV
ncbi:hypothetical protein [Micromonospora sp. WMMD998]|uniref:hypothetical protein n=1 Tax=Micromonospora sp. WMMD998 TaxID=3016092 RepID=UPI00249C8F50|nr:hypothetical protein [Micromonospora sp. WMMD998]WFE37710.1 hypothetical protein O7619_04370 [Micromonospora sp. WMMD998]